MSRLSALLFASGCRLHCVPLDVLFILGDRLDPHRARFPGCLFKSGNFRIGLVISHRLSKFSRGLQVLLYRKCCLLKEFRAALAILD